LAADCAIAAFEPVCHPPRPTDERTQESRNGDTTKGRIASTTALSLQQEPYRFNREPYRFNREPYRFNREPYRFNEGPCPRPQKVVIGACAPIHPRVGQSGPPGCLIRAGLLCDSAGRDGGRIAAAATTRSAIAPAAATGALANAR
jgi:hypothetical protein